VEALIEIFKKDDDLCYDFMQECLNEDNGDYLMDLLLECPDSVARANVATLLKYVINRLKVLEKDKLY
jgi:DNA-binding phage protein